jgi:hypothetical protein
MITWPVSHSHVRCDGKRIVTASDYVARTASEASLLAFNPATSEIHKGCFAHFAPIRVIDAPGQRPAVSIYIDSGVSRLARLDLGIRRSHEGQHHDKCGKKPESSHLAAARSAAMCASMASHAVFTASAMSSTNSTDVLSKPVIFHLQATLHYGRHQAQRQGAGSGFARKLSEIWTKWAETVQKPYKTCIYAKGLHISILRFQKKKTSTLIDIGFA